MMFARRAVGGLARRAVAHFHRSSFAGGLPTTLVFSIQDRPGALRSILDVLSSPPLGVSLTSIESRPSRNARHDYEFSVSFEAQNQQHINAVVSSLNSAEIDVGHVQVASAAAPETPWFPRKITDLDTFAGRVLAYGAELDSDHPGFTDQAYRARRAQITQTATEYRSGQPLPTYEYTPDEIKTWGTVYRKLTALYPKHACREHRYVFPLLEANCGYSPNSIPQQRDVSRFLKECTGFTLRPVMGLLSSRDFLNALAFRVFFSTAYIRHHSVPLYTPEPDIVHELLGHAPLFADPDFADFSQEIGLASLGASEEDVKKLATLYWFTVEFGLCREGNDIRAYGAGLLSSFGELEYSIHSPEPKRLPFDPHKTSVTEYPITTFQPTYFVAESFRDMKYKVKEFALSLARPFAVRYNPYTESIEVLDTRDKVLQYAQTVHSNMKTLMSALEKLPH